MTSPIYSGYRFPVAVIHRAIWLYLRFTLSYRDVEELIAERGIEVSTRRSAAGSRPLVHGSRVGGRRENEVSKARKPLAADGESNVGWARAGCVISRIRIPPDPVRSSVAGAPTEESTLFHRHHSSVSDISCVGDHQLCRTLFTAGTHPHVEVLTLGLGRAREKGSTLGRAKEVAASSANGAPMAGDRAVRREPHCFAVSSISDCGIVDLSALGAKIISTSDFEIVVDNQRGLCAA
jgi:hypothetical protein